MQCCDLTECLKEMQFDESEIERFVAASEHNEYDIAIRILINRRKKIVNNMHSLQKNIECVDYLIHEVEEMRKAKK